MRACSLREPISICARTTLDWIRSSTATQRQSADQGAWASTTATSRFHAASTSAPRWDSNNEEEDLRDACSGSVPLAARVQQLPGCKYQPQRSADGDGESVPAT